MFYGIMSTRKIHLLIPRIYCRVVFDIRIYIPVLFIIFCYFQSVSYNIDAFYSMLNESGFSFSNIIWAGEKIVFLGILLLFGSYFSCICN